MKKTYTEQEMQVISMSADVITTSPETANGTGQGATGGPTPGSGPNLPPFGP